MNAKMPELKRAFEAAGFTDVKTLLSSGNVLFSARAGKEHTLARKAETAMTEQLGKSFMTFVRSRDALRALLLTDPYRTFGLAPGTKRVVTLLQEPKAHLPKLPIVLENARILHVEGTEVFSAYVPGSEGPVFMRLIEKTFGKDVTTRTWDTLQKAAR